MSRSRLLPPCFLSTAGVGGVLFGAAGRWDLPAFRAYLCVLLAFMLGMALTMDLDLLEERLRPGPGGRDNLRLLRLLILLVICAHWGIAGLDAGRFHWSRLPFALQIVGLLGVAAALGVWRWAMRVNPFFSTAVRLQPERGHRVIAAGPYRWVRHPGYAALVFLLMPGSALALGSLPSLLPLAGALLLFLRRTALEDRLLQEELAGYREYAARVRWRLLPGLW